MPFHVNAFLGGTVPATDTLTALVSIADPIIHQLNNGIQIPGPSPAGPGSLHNLWASWYVGTNAKRGQLQSPSLRDQPFPTFEPVNIGTANESPIRIHEFFDNPIVVADFEELDNFGANTTGGATNIWGFTILSDGIPNPVKGQFLHVRWTAAATLTAEAWTAFAPVFDTALTVGNYAVVGGFMRSTTALAWRVVPASGNPFRPGAPAGQVFDFFNSRWFRDGRLGQWMIFNSLTPPQIEVFATAADTVEEGVLDLIAL